MLRSLMWLPLVGLSLYGTAGAVEIRPLAFFTGADSQVAGRSYRLVSDARSWNKVWLEHQGKTAQEAFNQLRPMLEWDFENCTVIAVFHGEGINSRALSIKQINETDEEIVVRFDNWTYQTSSGADRSTTYGFIVLPKTDKPIVLEENTQGLKDRPAKWTQRARLDAVNPVVRPEHKHRPRRPAPPPPSRPKN